MCIAMSKGDLIMRICGKVLYNGARYEFISLRGDFKFVYCQLLKHMKKWSVRWGDIYVDGDGKYTVYVGDSNLLIYRWSDHKECAYNREG